MTHNRSPDREKGDAKLIARIRRGDAAALGALMRDYVDELASFAFIIVHSMDLAQDAVRNMDNYHTASLSLTCLIDSRGHIITGQLLSMDDGEQQLLIQRVQTQTPQVQTSQVQMPLSH